MITKDGYATVPWGERFVLIYNGFQLSDHKTEEEAIEALKKHQKKTKGASKRTGTRSKSKAKLVLE
jgi:hypothetical protein